MGNYKSRPSLTCADECKKRISAAYSLIRSRLNDDLKPRFDSQSPFYQSCFQGSFDEFVSLFDSRYLDEKVPPRDLSLLHLLSIGNGDAQRRKIEFVLQQCEDDAKRRAVLLQRTPNNFHLLHIAAYKGDLALTETLLLAGADANAFVDRAPAPLHLAVMSGNQEMIKLFRMHGADIHARDLVQFTALHCAAFFSQEKAVKTLLLCGADPNFSGGVNDRPLHIAAGKPHLGIVKLLLDAGADSSMCDDEGNTPIHVAACSGHSAILAAILNKSDQKDILTNKTNIYGDTPLHGACYKGKLEAAKLLLQETNGDALQMENLFNEIPFQAACTSGKSLELVSFLIRQPAVNPNYQSKDGHTALHSACYHGHLRIVQYLLDNGADQSLTARAIEPNPAETRGHVTSTIFALTRMENSGRDSGRNSTYSLTDDSIPQQQTPIIWAYEKGHDQIVALLKFYANKRPESDVCSEYSSGDSSYTPLPSPMGRLRSITKEKAEVLQLRDNMDSGYRLSLMDIELLEAIGSGSFGKVYRGICKNKVVAVKRYRALAFGSKSEVDIFCREASILCKLKHANVIGFVGACLDDPSQFAIVTEYAASGSLFSLLHVQKRVIDMRLRLCIGLDVARGMRYLHEVANPAILHRDLNSHNILLHRNGRAVVADFGESRFMAEHEEDNMTKQPGNLRWMAPEVFSQSCRYDEKVDVYSYSLVVWEIHTSELPFASLKPAAAAYEMALKNNRPELPSTATPQFPEHIIEIISSSWNTNASLRPTFSQILTIIEPHAISDDERNFTMNQEHPEELTDEEGFSETDVDESAELRNDGNRTVSRLKTQWERFCVDDKQTRSHHKLATGERPTSTSNSVIQKLRQRLDTNGYVSQSGKNSLCLHDRHVLARRQNVARLAFKEANDQTTSFSIPTNNPPAIDTAF
ncbi:Serine/threonine-protein kinase TNNI3K [Aphelenchoides besseyi]|nr:Serine/threonine-protein kinase TNNI3K [Aphelenchoides besseyi]KAI6235838.1 Serine/threonine-protein kinase TNNI3K [Aphelenchoides besseyi]